MLCWPLVSVGGGEACQASGGELRGWQVRWCPSRRVTWPVGVEPPLETVTEKVMGEPVVLGLTDEVTATEAGSTSSTWPVSVTTDGELEASELAVNRPSTGSPVTVGANSSEQQALGFRG